MGAGIIRVSKTWQGSMSAMQASENGAESGLIFCQQRYDACS